MRCIEDNCNNDYCSTDGSFGTKLIMVNIMGHTIEVFPH